MSYSTLNLEVTGAIATLTLNRPQVRNALDKQTVDEAHSALAEIAGRRDVAVLVVTGAGDRAFVSGADIRELRDRDKHAALEGINQRLFDAVEDLPQPVVAAVNGHALGGGFELALACDIRIASQTARFGFPETGLGIIPGAGGTQRLPRLIGWSRARYLILTGEILDAAEAERIGLVSRVVPGPELMAAALETARRIAARGPLATRLAKVALNAASRGGIAAGLSVERLAQAVLFESRDKREGMSAFLEKREPKFEGD